MKKTLLKAISVVPITIGSTIPLINITSCGKSADFKQLEQDTINEFKLLAQFPHSSDLFLYEVPNNSNCKAISNYLKNRVKELIGVEPTQDIYSNLWFDVPANDSKYKDAPTIALQAHMDMVFTYDDTKYEQGQEPDPIKTPIEVVEDVVDGKRVIHSKDYKTSIGGDNCIGIASILALIQNPSVKHGLLRVIFTNCEENAMQGAMMMVEGYEYEDGSKIPATNPNIMKGIKYVLNLDAGIGKDICISCSGGVGSHYSKEYESGTHLPALSHHFKLTAEGFTGGHSGGVPRQDLGNPIKAVNEVLEELVSSEFSVELVNYLTPGVLAYNVVGKEAEVEFMTNATTQDVQSAIDVMYEKHDESDDEFFWKDIVKDNIKVNDVLDEPEKVLNVENSNTIITLHAALWYGHDKEAAKQGIKTSANIGPTELKFNEETEQFDFKTSSYSRSDSEDKIIEFKTNNKQVAAIGGFDYLCDAQFHPWAKDKNTKWLDLAKEASAHALECNKDEITEYEAHAGFECSWWSYALKNIEHIDDGACICLGVNVTDEHSFNESIQVDSIKDCMEAVTYMFENSINIK